MKTEYTVTIEHKNSEPVAPKTTIEEPIMPLRIIDMPGRPRVYAGEYHNYAARLRKDIYDFIKTQVGEDKQYRSINELINSLLLEYIIKIKNNS